MNFKEITISDKNKIEEYLLMKNYYMCDYTFLCLFMWKEYYNYKYCIVEDMLVISLEVDGKKYFSFPIGEKDPFTVIDLLLKEVPNLLVANIPAEILAEFEKRYKCIVESNQDWEDYLYNADDLKKLSGKKYKSKRNHVNAFITEYNYKYYTINEKNAEYVKKYLHDFDKHTNYKEEMLVQDKNHSLELLDHFKELEIIGGYIEIDGKIIAASIGKVWHDTLYVSVEKANRNIRGSYEMINYLFSNQEGIKFINREDDLGDLGIRAAKESYHPVRLVKKYCAVFIREEE